jgi:hypothetical protein
VDTKERTQLRELATSCLGSSSDRLRRLAEGCLVLLNEAEEASRAVPPPVVEAPDAAPASKRKFVPVHCACREMRLWREI